MSGITPITGNGAISPLYRQLPFPDEITLLILSFLPVNQIPAVALSCRQLRHLCNSDSLWKIFLRKDGVVESSASLDAVKSPKGLYRSALTFSQRAYSPLYRQLPFPDELTLLILSFLPVNQIPAVALSCRQLRHLCNSDSLWKIFLRKDGYAESSDTLATVQKPKEFYKERALAFSQGAYVGYSIDTSPLFPAQQAEYDLIPCSEDRVLVKDSKGKMSLWKVETSGVVSLNKTFLLKSGYSSTSGYLIGPDLLAMGLKEGKIALWDLQKCSEGENFPVCIQAGEDYIEALAPLSGKRLASISQKGCIKIWDLASPDFPCLLTIDLPKERKTFLPLCLIEKDENTLVCGGRYDDSGGIYYDEAPALFEINLINKAWHVIKLNNPLSDDRLFSPPISKVMLIPDDMLLFLTDDRLVICDISTATILDIKNKDSSQNPYNFMTIGRGQAVIGVSSTPAFRRDVFLMDLSPLKIEERWIYLEEFSDKFSFQRTNLCLLSPGKVLVSIDKKGIILDFTAGHPAMMKNIAEEFERVISWEAFEKVMKRFARLSEVERQAIFRHLEIVANWENQQGISFGEHTFLTYPAIENAKRAEAIYNYIKEAFPEEKAP